METSRHITGDEKIGLPGEEEASKLTGLETVWSGEQSIVVTTVCLCEPDREVAPGAVSGTGIFLPLLHCTASGS